MTLRHWLFIGIGVAVIAPMMAYLISLQASNADGNPAKGQVRGEGQDEPTLGAIPGDSFDQSCFKWNGQTKCNLNIGMAATSSYLCQVQNPARATSTIDQITVAINRSAFGAANVFSISTSSAQFASSSPALVLNATIPSNGATVVAWEPALQATSTAGRLGYDTTLTGASPFTLNPNEWITVRISTSSPSAFGTYPTGTCGFSTTKF